MYFFNEDMCINFKRYICQVIIKSDIPALDKMFVFTHISSHACK